VDAGGREVRLTGVNWSGMESGSFTPIGLNNRVLGDVLDQIVAAGFNTLRLPYSNQLLDPMTKPNGANYRLNPDLQGLGGLELLDRVIDGCRQRGLRVILDRHRLSADEQSEVWFSGRVSEARWIQDWVMLARHYRGNEAVIGADLTNEPHGAATWGDDNPGTDWRLAAERAGNAVLAANPDWLVIVEGVQRINGDGYWWGGNLSLAGQLPVRLADPTRLMYSAHDYGPDESQQYWFQGPDFAAGLPVVWRRNWAYLQQDGIAPVLIGEFGGRSIGGDAEGIWQRTLIAFLQDGGYSNLYWVWNPDPWIGGIMMNDRGDLDRAKLGLLAPGQGPLLGRPARPPPTRDDEHSPATPSAAPNSSATRRSAI
jgi:endoglucanase